MKISQSNFLKPKLNVGSIGMQTLEHLKMSKLASKYLSSSRMFFLQKQP